MVACRENVEESLRYRTVRESVLRSPSTSSSARDDMIRWSEVTAETLNEHERQEDRLQSGTGDMVRYLSIWIFLSMTAGHSN